VLVLQLIALGALAQERGSSRWVSTGADGKLVYQTTPAGDRIMDFSYAGYMGGGVAIPQVAVKRVVKPSGGDDDTAAIQSAIDEVAKLPLEGGFRGAVLLSPGTYPCAGTITLAASGVVLRGSGQGGAEASTIKLAGAPHLAIAVRGDDATNRRSGSEQSADIARTDVADAYVPSGAMAFTIADAGGLSSGDTILIRKPVTAAWVKFMGMDDMTRDGKPQTWIKTGSVISAERRIAEVDGKRIALDVPLSDSLDARYLNPPGVVVAKVKPPARLSQVGIEDLHIESPRQEINHAQPHFTALRLNGEDCWARNLTIDETMNSVAAGGRRITLQRVIVNRKAKHQGSSKPAEFAPNGSQVLMDRCAVNADNVWFVATGAGVSGPVVILDCTFTGNGRAESHQRWSTGLLYDNCKAPDGGFEFRNRGSMGSGHGWTMGWGVMWNCVAKDYVVQNPPGATNWMIGCVGENKAMPRPFGEGPMLPKGVEDSSGVAVQPRSLYLAQLAERLGAGALKATGY
jgi:hypothetical protein